MTTLQRRTDEVRRLHYFDPLYRQHRYAVALEGCREEIHTMKSFRVIASVMLLGLVCAATPARASVIAIGDTVDISYRFPDLGSHYNAGVNDISVVVTPAGPEVASYPLFDDVFSIDFDTNLIVMDYHLDASWSAASFNGPYFSGFTGLTIVALLTNLPGLDLGDISFGSDFLAINWQGLDFDADTFVRLKLGEADVPEPTSMLLFGIASAGLASRRFRQLRRQRA